VRFFTVERERGRFRWRYSLKRMVVSNSLMQYSIRECKANIQAVVFWSTRKVLESDEENRYTLLARGNRTSNLLIVPFLDGWTWRLKDARRVYFQPDLERGFDDPLDAFDYFLTVRAAFAKLPPKATRKVILPSRSLT
jgi:hypothetical protein